MILFLAVNGVSEAFAHSVMVRRVLSVRIVCYLALTHRPSQSPRELASANLFLLVSICLLLSTFDIHLKFVRTQITSAFTVAAAAGLQFRLGSLGFILANCFAMTVRIAYTLCYVHYVRFANCSEHRFIECLPRKETILVFCATTAVTVFTSTLRPFVHLCSGALVFIVIIGALSRFEASSIRVMSELKNKQD